MRVSRSATGSVILIFLSSLSRAALPARLDDSRQVALERQIPEADPAQRELPQVGPRPSTAVTAVPMTNLVLQLAVVLRDLRSSSHLSVPLDSFLSWRP